MRYYIKLNVSLFNLSFNSSLFANSDQIKSIEVLGTQRIDIETVISYSNLEIEHLQ